jgi:hypothetical protein
MVKSSDREEYLRTLQLLEGMIATSSFDESEEYRRTHAELLELQANVEAYLDQKFIDLSPLPFTKKAYRAVKAQYQASPLSWEGSLAGHGRYHRAEQATLYFCENPATISYEIPSFSFANYQYLIYPVEISLQKIIDVNDQNQLNTPVKKFLPLLHREWGLDIDILNLKPFTHIFSDIARKHGLEGIRYSSVRAPAGQANLALFPKNLLAGSKIILIDPQTGQAPVELHRENLHLFDFQH